MSDLARTWLQDTYPVRSLELPKGGRGPSSADDIVAGLRSRIDRDEGAAFPFACCQGGARPCGPSSTRSRSA